MALVSCSLSKAYRTISHNGAWHSQLKSYRSTLTEMTLSFLGEVNRYKYGPEALEKPR